MGGIARLVRHFAPPRSTAPHGSAGPVGGSTPVATAVPDCLILVDQTHRISLPFVRYGSGVAIVASSPRRTQHPAWSNNLLTKPESTVIVNDHEVAVRARLASDDEAQELWPKLIEVWPPLSTYRKQVDEHSIRLFILEPR